MDKIFSKIQSIKQESKDTHLISEIKNDSTYTISKPDTSFLIDHVEYTEPSAQELKLLEGTRNPKEQLEAEAKEEPIYMNDRRMFIDMIKVIALIETGHSALDNPSNYNKREKQEVIKAMEKLLDYPKEKINEKFNEICETYICIWNRLLKIFSSSTN